MIFVLEDDLEFVRSLPCCGCNAPAPSQAAHCLSRGAGEVSIRENLVGLCFRCHTESHYTQADRRKPALRDLLATAAEREGLDPDVIRDAVHAIRRLPKAGHAAARSIVQALRGLGGSEPPDQEHDDDDLPPQDAPPRPGDRPPGLDHDEALRGGWRC